MIEIMKPFAASSQLDRTKKKKRIHLQLIGIVMFVLSSLFSFTARRRRRSIFHHFLHVLWFKDLKLSLEFWHLFQQFFNVEIRLFLVQDLFGGVDFLGQHRL